jgi:DMSO/TMAO reductase YedYZ molybdopterin-dependent catalytic subunit
MHQLESTLDLAYRPDHVSPSSRIGDVELDVATAYLACDGAPALVEVGHHDPSTLSGKVARRSLADATGRPRHQRRSPDQIHGSNGSAGPGVLARAEPIVARPTRGNQKQAILVDDSMSTTVDAPVAPAGSDPAPASRAAWSGAAAAAVALTAGELVSALAGTGQSLVAGVGNEVVDRSAGGLVKWAIEVFGTADKAVLITAIVLISLGLGAWLGRASLKHPWAGPVGFAAFGAIGLIAGVRDPLASGPWVVAASISAVLAGWATLTVLLRVARSGHALPVATPRTIELPSDRKASRRAFFGWAGAAGAFAATGAVAARSLRNRSTVEAQRAGIILPRPGTSAVVGPDGFEVDGLTPYVIPNDRFYRIDTALIVPQVDVTSWKLDVTGLVDEPFEMTFDELLAMPTVEEAVTLSCVSNSVGGQLVGNAIWRGVHLRDVLDRAGVQADATQVVGKSVDGFTVGFPTEAVYDGRTALVAFGMNGEPLPVNHGFPARLVVSGLFGYVSATKWLSELRLTRWEDFDAYWIPRGWAKEGPVVTQSRIDVPATGKRLSPGLTPVAGVAWAPGKGISKVEVQIDDEPWVAARLGDVLSDDTWRQWVLEWQATPGTHRLRVRATDGTGETQTEDESPPAPDGATGWHERTVSVVDS